MKLSALALPLLILAFSQISYSHTAITTHNSTSSSEPYQWTGYYVGFNLGAVRNTFSMTDNQATTFSGTINEVTNPTLSGGLQIGYRHQMDLSPISAVYGVELMADLTNANYEKNYGSPFALYQINSKNELDSVILLQALGGIAVDRTYLFLAAGLSWTDIVASTQIQSTPFTDSFNADQKGFGTALGGGIEYAVTSKFSARFKVDVITPITYTATDGLGNSFQIANNIVLGTFGLNYKFA